MRRIRSAINVLMGLSEDQVTGSRYPIYCRPESWRCSICGGGLISGPKGKPVLHSHNGGCWGKSTRLSVRYVGLRAHLSRVWASLWGNRPRVVRTAPRASYGPSSALGPAGGSVYAHLEPDKSDF